MLLISIRFVSLIFVSIENIYQTLEIVFCDDSEHVEARQNSSLRVVFSILCGNMLKNCCSCSIYWANS